MSKLRREIARDDARSATTQRGARRRNEVPVGRDRRLHQRRQVQPAQRAHRRRACSSRTRCSPPSTRPPGAPSPPTGAPTRSPTPSGSSGTCRTSSSRRSGRRWRRRPTPTCCVHVVDASDPLPEDQIKAVRQVLVEIGEEQRRPDAARAAGGQQDRRRGRPRPGPAAPPAAGRGVRLRAPRRRHRAAARPHRRAAPAARRSTSSCCCPTPRARWWPGCTPRARCSPRSTPPTAPGCTPGSAPSWPRRCCRSPVGGPRATVGARHRVREALTLSLPPLSLRRGLARPGRAIRPDRGCPRRGRRCAVDDPRLAELSGLAVDGDGRSGRWPTAAGGSSCTGSTPTPAPVVDSRTAAVDPFDPEDLALGPDGALWVGDIGDNGRRRDTVALIVVPARGAPAAPADLPGRPARRGGPARRRARAADRRHEGASVPAGVYRPEAPPAGRRPDPAAARRRGGRCPRRTPSAARSAGSGRGPSPGPRSARTGGWSRCAATPTPGSTRCPPAVTSWRRCAATPVRVPLPDEPQGEAIAFAPDGTLVSGSEARGGAAGQLRGVAGAAALVAGTAPTPTDPAPPPSRRPLRCPPGLAAGGDRYRRDGRAFSGWSRWRWSARRRLA